MVVFTDLDGTLLDRETYSFAPARPAIDELRRRGIPLVLVTSKTAAEVSALRKAMRNESPYVVENGGAIILPDDNRIVFGVPREQALEALLQAASTSGAVLRTFSEMTIGEIRERSGLPEDAALLAAQREYGEPFVLLSELRRDALTAEVERLGFRLTQGGRFNHILAGNEKARAVVVLSAHLRDSDTVGLGDAPNDISFLREVRRAVIIPSRYLAQMRSALPYASVASEEGPAGWNSAVLALLDGAAG
jgi:mannosyl-3-phosphoglycerate phosphatase